MKKLIIPILFLLFLSSCVSQTPYIYKVDGTFLTKKQWDRSSKRAHRIAMRSLSKEERGLLLDVPVKFTYGEQNK